MSDYISKSAVLEIIDKEIDKEVSDVHQFIVHNTQLAIRHATLKLPTVDEKEIIRKAFERVVERVENARQKYQRLVKEQGEKEDEAMNIHFRGVMNIVKEEGEIDD